MSDERTAILSTRVGITAGWGVLIFFGFGMIAGQFIPPPGPYGAEVTAGYFESSIDLKRAAVISLIIGGTFMIPFGAAIADRLRRVPGIGVPIALSQFGAACAAAILMMAFGPFLQVGLLFPDLSAESHQLLSHLTWMVWAGIWQPGALQAIAVATAVLSDKSNTPPFPRWVGWYCLFMALGSLMGLLIPFVTSGPFAWNGAIAFFVAGANYFVWFAVMLTLFHRTARRQRLWPPPVAESIERSLSVDRTTSVSP